MNESGSGSKAQNSSKTQNGSKAQPAAVGLALLMAAGAVIFAAGYLLSRRLPDPLLQAEPGIESLGARLDKVTLTAWEPVAGPDAAEALAARIVGDLQVIPAPITAATLAPGAGNERQAYTLPNGQGRLVLSAHRSRPSTVSALLELPAPADRWWTWRKRLVRAMTPQRKAIAPRRGEAQNGGEAQGHSATPRVYTVLEYSESGDRLWSARRTVATGILDTLGARTVEGADDGNLYSLTAYTPRLQPRLLVAGRPVNAAVALHWDAAGRRTRLWLGSPVINVEY